MDKARVHPTKDRRRARAEAAAWIVRLHGPKRTPELEAGFRRWLTAEPENARQFERVTEMWESAPNASTAGLPRLIRWERSSRQLRWAIAGALLLACVAGILMTSHRWRDIVYVTGIGEQRQIPLDDGTRISLNSNSVVQIEFSSETRLVRLIHGEAYFEVAHNAKRPFVVVAGDQRVTAVGTVFEVRYEAGRVDVTLVEGKVSVMPVSTNVPATPIELKKSMQGAVSNPSGSGYIIAPGERLTVVQGVQTRVDEPRLDAITAWRRSEVLLDNTPLSEAVAEMNRYCKNVVIIDERRISDLRVSGIYHTGDSEGFARTIANLYGLHVSENKAEIHLNTGAMTQP